MNKLDYVVRQLARTKSKKYEQYVVTGIIHKLRHHDIKFVTQQYVLRSVALPDLLPDSEKKASYKRALTDLYFPALGIHIEVDEPFHEDKENVEKDKLRESDIVNATKHDILRVEIKDKTLKQIDERIDACVLKICEKFSKLSDFKPWNLEDEYSIKQHIDRGHINANDNVAFKLVVDACNCFGHNYKGYQQSTADHPHFSNISLWFPKLFENEDWSNTITDDEKIIKEYAKDDTKRQAHFDSCIADKRNKRIVFAKAKDNLGMLLYRFKGLYELNIERSREKNMIIWERIATEVDTFPEATPKLD